MASKGARPVRRASFSAREATVFSSFLARSMASSCSSVAVLRRMARRRRVSSHSCSTLARAISRAVGGRVGADGGRGVDAVGGGGKGVDEEVDLVPACGDDGGGDAVLASLPQGFEHTAHEVLDGGDGAVGVVHGEEAGEELVVVTGEATGDDFCGLGEGDDALFEVDGDVNVRGVEGAGGDRHVVEVVLQHDFLGVLVAGGGAERFHVLLDEGVGRALVAFAFKESLAEDDLKDAGDFPAAPVPGDAQVSFLAFRGVLVGGVFLAFHAADDLAIGTGREFVLADTLA